MFAKKGECSVFSEFRNLFRVQCVKGVKLASNRHIVPKIGLCVILGYALAVEVQIPKAVLPQGAALLSSLAKPERA
ncbi:MAG TPA: hypothetical protein VFC29_04005 [Candidatus Limnocylindrales bacterium]|nr:hypothetical protein [Candidatus Limnocylindrales bacterium]